MINMGTKKGQMRKTARRAYEPKRRAKIIAADRYKRLMMNGHGKKRSKDDAFDSYKQILRNVLTGKW